MDIIIGSDIVPTEVNINLFNTGDTLSLLGEDLLNIWDSSDIRVFNLETPLTDLESPIEKQGPNLIAPTSTIKGIKELNPSLVTLANNHILDQGVQGLQTTCELLDSNNIPNIGAGDNLSEAAKPFIIKKDKKKIGFYTCAEHEFTIATEKSSGANPFDPFESLDHIAELKSKCDFVIVLYHGGKEHYRYPSPYLQKACRKIVQKGADIVICQHSHCIGSFEKHKESTIVYGQGNFIFNKLDNDFWNTSLLINVKVSDKLDVEYIPIVRTEKGTRLANEKEKGEILNNFNSRSLEILKDDFIQKRYNKFAKESLGKYLRSLSGYGKWMSRIDRRIFKGNLAKRKYRKKELLRIRNHIECEAHRELLLKGIKGENDSGR